MIHAAKLALCAGLLGAPLAAAQAADLLLVTPAGQPIAVVQMPDQAAMIPAPIDFPGIGLFAQQDAMIRRMMEDVQVLQNASAMGEPAMQEALMPGFPQQAAPGSMVVVSSFSNGRQSCSRTVTYQSQANGAPVMHVSQTGSACGAMPAGGSAAPLTVDAPQEVPQAAPQAAPRPLLPAGSQFYRVDYRHPVTAANPEHG